MAHIYDVEYTDTFGGEANYAWVKRKAVYVPEMRHDNDLKYVDRMVKRLAKSSVGLEGVRGEWSEYGDTYEFRPRGMCVVLFVTYREHVCK